MILDFLQPQPPVQSGQALMRIYAVGKDQVLIQNFCTKNAHQFLPCELREEGLSCQPARQTKFLKVMVTNSKDLLLWAVEGSTRHSYKFVTLQATDIKIKDLCLDFGGLPSLVDSACCLWEMAVNLDDHIQHKGWSVSHDIAGLYGGPSWKACANTRNKKRESELKTT